MFFMSLEIGWRAEFLPMDHPLSEYEFDVIIGADGRRNTLEGRWMCALSLIMLFWVFWKAWKSEESTKQQATFQSAEVCVEAVFLCGIFCFYC